MSEEDEVEDWVLCMSFVGMGGDFPGIWAFLLLFLLCFGGVSFSMQGGVLANLKSVLLMFLHRCLYPQVTVLCNFMASS